MAFVALAVLWLPALGALLLALGAFRLPRRQVQLIGPGVVWLAFIGVLALFAGSLAAGPAQDFTYWTWVRSGGFHLPFDLLVDRLSIFMCLVITGVGGLIVTYSVGYMEHEQDAGYARFFCYMDVFIFSMLLLVLAGNFVFLIIGWALVGLSSYLLIGFWYWRHAAVLAARKAFVMNVVGDIGMILAAFAIFAQYHATTYLAVFSRLPKSDGGWLEAIAFLFLVGGVAKSAQIPLHTWLPDAMEGPTPVSALIHAATMVTAGVYLIGRMHPIFDVAFVAHGTAATIGAVTALFAATIAIVQTDIKRVLAYSTMSQIGYMFLGAGIGAYGAAFFHLLSHAFFKALLFLSAGNVIHGMEDEQDMRRFGGLFRVLSWRPLRLGGDLPRTSLCFLSGALSLVGIVPFIGFWSKETVLGDTFSRGDPLALALWAIGFLTALLTGLYTGRMWWIAFWGGRSPERPVAHPHEAPPVMLVPVAVLALLCVVGGFIQINAGFQPGWKLVEDFLAPSVGPLPWKARGLEYAATAATVLLSAATFGIAFGYYVSHRWSAERLRTRFAWIQRLLERKYYFDEAYDAAFVSSLDEAAEEGRRLVEEPLIDGAVTGLAAAAERGAGALSLIENGYFRTYALVILGSSVVLGVLLLLRIFV